MKTTNPDISLFHNPSCRTSRHVLAQIRETGFEPQVVNPLNT
jgi:arsenate reductase